MHTPLDKTLRNNLERAVIKARDIAELAAKEELTRLSVGNKAAADYLKTEQKSLRNRLRIHGRALGDFRKPTGEQTLNHLISEVAYEHWHRMLFARFLAENNLLMYEDGVTALSIQDCFELAEEETGDSANGWLYASQYAAKMLPQIFRINSPVFELQLAPNYQKQLEQLLAELATEVFTASDSLGWVYQFWQTKKKEEVNAAEVKIGADELPAVTQLFTEPYMVSFLLDNSLGAWWATRKLTEQDYATAKSEAELRKKAAIDGVPLTYLRFVQQENGVGHKRWTPAAGTIDGWPKQLAELKILDPCCGSGHFLVAALNMLVPIRMAEKNLNAQKAVDAVIRDNIHGLELDQRCVELAAFALALSAWKYPDAGGYRVLPELNVACSGLSISAKKEDWVSLAGDNINLRVALEELFKQFKDAPVLGSLINPEANLGKGTLFELRWDEVEPLLTKALADEKDNEKSEMGVVARGLVRASSILTSKFNYICTNPPYLTVKKQDSVLKRYGESKYPHAKHDVATVFLCRILDLFRDSGCISIVLPQNWTFQPSYKSFRKSVFRQNIIQFIARLGSGAFESISGEIVKAVLLNLGVNQNTRSYYVGIDVSDIVKAENKAEGLTSRLPSRIDNSFLSSSNDSIVKLAAGHEGPDLLADHAISMRGIVSGDNDKWTKKFYEVDISNKWKMYQGTPGAISFFTGKTNVIDWSENGKGMLRPGTKNEAYGCKGIAIGQIGDLPSTLFEGELYDNSTGVLIPCSDHERAALWAYTSSKEYSRSIREIDQALKVTNATLVKANFDLEHWINVAEEKYPNGLPKPYTDDPTQWIFHGHPCGSVVWSEQTKWTVEGDTRIDNTVLQIAVARLLGYRWPTELDAAMELADEQRTWVKRCERLLCFADDDGIVCLPAVRGEQAAHDRLEALLQAAYGKEWSTQTRNKLLEAVDCKNQSLEFWLREKFFEQHCKLFQHRPFIWHVWDGLKDGFSALLNYHQLNQKNLERLVYTYLEDWIRHQKLAAKDRIDGADIRVNAAERLKERLEQILTGEAPYDIFVRWKSLTEQPIGWNPDLNDGVRMNIRPFVSVGDVGKKGAGILKAKPNIKWDKDRGKDVESAPWFKAFGGDRINDHHLSLAEKLSAKK